MADNILSTGASGMIAMAQCVNLIANNIANSNTLGYKEQYAVFSDLMYNNIGNVGSTSGGSSIIPGNLQIGLGTKLVSISQLDLQGSLKRTGSQLDLAVNGRGYFMVTLPNGNTAYTRAGKFSVLNGQLVTPQGYVLQPGITIPPNNYGIIINKEGLVQAKMTTAPVTYQTLGQISLALFANESGLNRIGDNLLGESEASGTPLIGLPNSDPYGALEQEMLEESNVDVIIQVTNLIQAQRGYDNCSKVIQAGDEMARILNNLKA